MLLRSCLVVSYLIVLVGGVCVHKSIASSHSSDSLHINRFVLSTNVENREPQNVKESFTTDDKQVFAFVEVSTPTSETITFVWSRDGKVHFEMSAHIAASPRFRTYTSVRALPGYWTVKIQDQSGKVLEEKSFEIPTSSGHSENTKSAETNASVNSANSPKGVKDALRSLQPKSKEVVAEPSLETSNEESVVAEK